jgi:hypothetical protein
LAILGVFFPILADTFANKYKETTHQRTLQDARVAEILGKTTQMFLKTI